MRLPLSRRRMRHAGSPPGGSGMGELTIVKPKQMRLASPRASRINADPPGVVTTKQRRDCRMRPRTNFNVIGLGVIGLGLMSALTQPLPASAQTADTIRFGASLPLTGALATYGKRVKDGYDFYARHVNDLGGIDIGGKKYKVSITYYDDESKTDAAL